MPNQGSETAFTRYAHWIYRWRFAVVVASLIACFGLMSGLKDGLGFDTSYRVFFGEDNPQLQAFEKLEQVYNKNDNIMIAIAPKDGNVFDAEFLQIVADVTDEGWQFPYARRVDSLTNYQHSWAEEDDLLVDDLIVPADATEADLRRAREVALGEPQLVNRIITERCDVTAINITLELPGIDPAAEVPEAVAHARNLREELLEKHDDIDVYLSGVVLLNNAFAEGGQNDMSSLTPLMFGMIVVMMWVLLRSLAGTISALLVIIFSMGAALGATALLGIKLTPPSAIAPNIIMTLAVADSVHILITFFSGMRQGLDKRDAMAESIRINLSPVFLTSFTTAIGFMSLNFSDAPPFRDLGNIAAMGVAAAFILSVTFLPALVSILPVRIKVRDASQKLSRGDAAMDNLAEWVIAKRRPLLWGGTAVVVGLIAMIPLNTTDDMFVNYFDESVSFRADSDFIMENLTGLYQLDYSLSAGEDGGISDPAYLAKLEEFEAWMREQPGVLQVNSIAHVMKRLNKNMHADDPAMFKLPENRDLAAQYLLLYEMSLPYGLDLNNQINVAKSATRFSAILDNMSSVELRAIAQRGEAWLAENAPEGMFSHGIGPSIMFSYISERNIRSMIGGTAIALVLISISLMFALRSLRYGMVSLIPNLIPAAMAFGLWGLLVSRIDIGLSTVVAISLGIVVDDSVHFLSKYLRARREKGLDAPDAVRYAFSTVGKALVVTSVVLVAGFLVMTRSTFAMNSNMGWFTVIAVTFALLADFLLLPALLILLDRRGAKKDVRVEEPRLAQAQA